MALKISANAPFYYEFKIQARLGHGPGLSEMWLLSADKLDFLAFGLASVKHLLAAPSWYSFLGQKIGFTFCRDSATCRGPNLILQLNIINHCFKGTSHDIVVLLKLDALFPRYQTKLIVTASLSIQ